MIQHNLYLTKARLVPACEVSLKKMKKINACSLALNLIKACSKKIKNKIHVIGRYNAHVQTIMIIIIIISIISLS